MPESNPIEKRMTPQERRLERLKNDYEEMCNILGPIIQWKATRGGTPYVTEYQLVVRVHTIIGSSPTYRDENNLKLVLPSNYPDAPPRITCLDRPKPFHPNWFVSDARWCQGVGAWTRESLGRHVIRMVRTLQYDGEITNPASAADPSANAWYQENLRRGWFPSDTQPLPDPTTSQRPRLRRISGSRTGGGGLRVIRRGSSA